MVLLIDIINKTDFLIKMINQNNGILSYIWVLLFSRPLLYYWLWHDGHASTYAILMMRTANIHWLGHESLNYVILQNVACSLNEILHCVWRSSISGIFLILRNRRLQNLRPLQWMNEVFYEDIWMTLCHHYKHRCQQSNTILLVKPKSAETKHEWWYIYWHN